MCTDSEFDHAEIRAVKDHARECFAHAISSTDIQGMHPMDAREALYDAACAQPMGFDTSLFWLEYAFDDALLTAIDDYLSV